MGTKIRAKISKKNKYWISKHRHYELKHFCLQYFDWKRAYEGIDSLSVTRSDLDKITSANSISDITAKCAMAKAKYAKKMDMVENAAKAADPDLWQYILKAVTEDLKKWANLNLLYLWMMDNEVNEYAQWIKKVH